MLEKEYLKSEKILNFNDMEIFINNFLFYESL